MKRLTLYLAAAVVLLLAPAAFAGTAFTNLDVSASVSNNCIISTTAMTFGAYDPIVDNLSTDLDIGNGKVTITCTNGATGLDIDLGPGVNFSSTRRMASGGNFLGYELYSDSSGGTIWTVAAGPSVATGTGVAQDYTVYGRVFKAQNAVVGSYSDTVVATINF